MSTHTHILSHIHNHKDPVTYIPPHTHILIYITYIHSQYPYTHFHTYSHTHPQYSIYVHYIYTSSIMYNSLMYTLTHKHTNPLALPAALFYIQLSVPVQGQAATNGKTTGHNWGSCCQLSTPSLAHRANIHQVKIKQFSFHLSILLLSIP